jgi:ABC-type branched-subunit amino acid transport system substrate-binding protein
VAGRALHRGGPRLLAVLVATITLAGLLAACGGSSSKSSGSKSTTTKAAASTGGLGVGVTPTTIKVGVALIDFDCIKNFTDSIRVNQDQVYGAYISDINAKGGINGRQIVPVYDSYCPIGSAGPLAVCTKFTEDDRVFAVIGNFNDFSGDAQNCVTKQHQRVLIAFNLTQAMIDQSPPGLEIYPGATNERLSKILLQLLDKKKTLKGKTVAVLGGTNETDVVNKTIVPTLKKMKVPLGTTAILSLGSSSDTTAAQAQLDSFIERWKTEHVNAIFLSGDEVSSIAFVTKLRKEMPNVLLMVDTTDVKSEGQQLTVKGVKPNPYEGMLSAGGPTPHEYDQSANWAYCKAIYEKYTGKPAPDAETIVKGPEGKTLDTNGNINDACQIVTMFHDVAVRAGKNLNNASWQAAANSYGEITNRGSGPYSSLRQGKYDVEDSFRLEAFDSSIPPQGSWRAVTPLQNITGS